ncbi:MAG: 16S rRNA (adenine(1518)-N(6)/adenine(1519)-N(6))-dimethyltransferase RsmA [Candidatus Firestonebacteria bacterium]
MLILKKSLGQNLLFDENILNEIVTAGEITKDDIVLEIGCGTGNLTKILAQHSKFVLGVEIDHNLCDILKENMLPYDNVNIVKEDILKIDLKDLITNFFKKNNLSQINTNVKVVGNLPYYITTPILIKLLKERENFNTIVIMVQKEVAERIVAKSGSKIYGKLSLLVQYYALPEIITKISAEAFSPKPKVDSALIKLKILPKPSVYVKDEEMFFSIIKAGFGGRRKMFKNTIKNALHLQEDIILKAFNIAKIDAKSRAEDLDMDKFAVLSEEFTKVKMHCNESLQKAK